MTNAVSLRPLEESDLDRLVRWLTSPHVTKWWHSGPTALLREKYEARIGARTQVDVYIIEKGSLAVGMLQAVYEDAPMATCGLDILVGDPTALRRGIASSAVSYFVSHDALHRHPIVRFSADPDAANIASIRAFEKAGFVVDKTARPWRWYLVRVA